MALVNSFESSEELRGRAGKINDPAGDQGKNSAHAEPEVLNPTRRALQTT